MTSPKPGFKFALAALILCGLIQTVDARVVDKIIAVVDSGVVLASDVENRIQDLKAREKSRGNVIEINADLREQVLERLILEQAQIEIAKRQGLEIDDARLNESLLQIANNREIDLLGLKNVIEAEGKSFKIFREQIRRRLLIDAIRDREVRRRIRIGKSELERFLETTGGQISTAPELLLSQIVIRLPNSPSPDALKKAEKRAVQIRDALLKGAPFAQMAARYSDGPEASQGGNLGWKSVLELNPIFAKPLADIEKNTLIGPIRSPGGFHLIAVRDRRGDQSVVITEYKVRHILIKPDTIRSPAKAKEIASNIRREIEIGSDFAALARRFSDDPLSAAKGGDLGWVRADKLVPGFANVMTNLPLNELSDVSFSKFGFHLIEVLETRESDISEEQIKDRARRILVERKFSQELESWLRQVRADAFVELKS
ncbi:MAG: peptidylprolyl isomerase SurA [Gammaproteobacteria bacterium]|nr:peptidylprolyl isomerase SurA [Gammaproteobacteria bacterium]HAN80214.1 peptidylprolyl isomerase SurA [Gammaproteobacteria bacterium]